MSIKVQNKKVFVGLSGGVDSAVSAALLKERGYDVTGVFIKAWTPDWEPCTWKDDRRSAMRAAAVLDIPFITLDLEKEYKDEVVDYMIAEYKEGRTPNPDVMCNKEIKFGKFLKFALENGAEYVATGHYAQKLKAESLELRGKKPTLKILNPQFSNPTYILKEGKDKNKDQSYFLWTLTQEQLKYILFPVGHLEKSEVRKLAGKFNLPQESRKDSQGLCFLGKVDMKDFLSHYIEHKKGNVLNSAGEVIGHHDGATFFTIGERHGFTIVKKSPDDLAYYVVAKDINKNTITVAPKKNISQKVLGFPRFARPDIFSKNLSWELKQISWISGKIPENKKVECRTRYRQSRVKCEILENKEGVFVRFEKVQEISSPGQSIVFYDKDKCIGGGIIDS